MRIRPAMTRALLAAAAAAVGAASATATAPGLAAVLADRPDDTAVVVDVSRVPDAGAAALAAALPEWEEAIAAGTERLTIALGDARALREQGFDVAVTALAEVLPPWPGCYARLDEVYAAARALSAAHPELLELIDIGDSHCKTVGGCTTPGGDPVPGDDIYVMRVTNEAAAGEKGALWVDAGIHAREIPTVELVVAFLESLVQGYGVDAEITALLNTRVVHIGLASNPDGRRHVEMGAFAPYGAQPWMWRKNGHDEGAGCAWPPTGGNQYGVDLNRNQAFKWDAEGHSEDPCDQTYRGTAPASEPEIDAYEAYVRSIFPDQRGEGDLDAAPLDTTGFLINYHNATYPGTVLVPWGWTTDTTANDAELNAIARRYAALNGYNVQYSLYPVSGNTRDWSYGELGIPSYVIELQGDNFVTSCQGRAEVIHHNLPGMRLALALADRPYVRIQGPEIVRLAASAAADGQIAVTARASELRSGRDAVAGLSASITRPDGTPIDAAPAARAFAAADGAFDERTENASLRLALADLPPGPGRLLLVAEASDAAGHAGPPAAVWLELPPRAGLVLAPIRRGPVRPPAPSAPEPR